MRWLAFVLLFVTSPAFADAIGPCPEGQIVVPNPATPGSGHHGGFHCDPDPNASHCSASPAREGGALAGLVALAALGALARHK